MKTFITKSTKLWCNYSRIRWNININRHIYTFPVSATIRVDDSKSTFFQEYRQIHNQPHKWQQAKKPNNEPIDKPKEPTKSLTTKEKLKLAIAEYGTTVIVFHITISLISLGCCYLLISSGVNIGGFTMESDTTNLAKTTGTFAVAYGVHKMLAPIRIGITLTATPFIVNYLRRMGFIK